jgi:hypothetical protein
MDAKKVKPRAKGSSKKKEGPGTGAPGRPRASRKRGEKAMPEDGSSDTRQGMVTNNKDFYFDDHNEGLPRNPDRLKPIGRPPEYSPRFDEWVLAWGARGKSAAWMAAEIGCAKASLDRWADAYESFRLAYTRAKLLSQQWWEDNGSSGIREAVFKGDVWKTSMSCRFPDDWREQKTVTMKADEGFAALWSAVAKGAVVLPEDDDEPKDNNEPT